MRGIIFLFIIALILETVFYPYPFTLLIVIMGVLALGHMSIYFAFFAGILLDILVLKPLGSDSIIFLCMTALMLRYNRRIHFTNIINVMIFIIISISLYSYFFYKGAFNIPNVVLTIILGFLLLFFLPMIIPLARERKKLQI